MVFQQNLADSLEPSLNVRTANYMYIEDFIVHFLPFPVYEEVLSLLFCNIKGVRGHTQHQTSASDLLRIFLGVETISREGIMLSLMHLRKRISFFSVCVSEMLRSFYIDCFDDGNGVMKFVKVREKCDVPIK